MNDFRCALVATAVLFGPAGCAALPPDQPAPATAAVTPALTDQRPPPALIGTPSPVVPPARSGSGRVPAVGSGGSAPASVVLQGDPLPRTPTQTLTPQRRPLP